MNLPEGMPLKTSIGLEFHRNHGVILDVGDYSYGTPALLYNPGDPQNRITIGKFCCFADDTEIFIGRYGRHHYDFLSTYPIGMVLGAPSRIDTSVAWNRDLGVTIGSDVWIARHATILAGVMIGHGAVIGAKALVNRDVEPYTVVSGVPAKPTRKRFTDRQIEQLLAIRWWDWPEDLLRKNIDLFYRADIDAVIAELERASTPHQ